MPWKKLLLALCAALLALPLGEGLYRALLAARGRAWSSTAARAEVASVLEFARAYGTDDTPRGPQLFHRYEGGDVLHPFTGFTGAGGNGNVRAAREYCERAPEALKVLILGGSVAAAFGKGGAERLGEVLRADPRLGGREVLFLPFGQPAFKQPQQLTRLAYLLCMGVVPDAVIDINGFNEVAVGNQNASHGSHPTHPAHDKWLSLALAGENRPGAAAEAQRLAAARRELAARAEAARDSWRLRSALLGGRLVDDLRARRAALQRGTQAYVQALLEAGVPEHLLGPTFRGGPAAVVPEIVRHWAEASRSMQALCAARGIVYLNVLQPAAHDEGAKPLTPEELADREVDATWVEGVTRGYPLLRATGAELAAEGLRFVDQSRVFAAVEERCFTDSVHLTPLGNRLLAEAIGAALLEALDAR